MCLKLNTKCTRAVAYRFCLYVLRVSTVTLKVAKGNYFACGCLCKANQEVTAVVLHVRLNAVLLMMS